MGNLIEIFTPECRTNKSDSSKNLNLKISMKKCIKYGK